MEKNKVSFKKIIFKVLKYICIALLSVIVLFSSGILLFSCIGSCNGLVSAKADQVTKLYDFTGSNVFLHSSHFRPSDFTIQYPDNTTYHGVIVEENYVETLNLQFSIHDVVRDNITYTEFVILTAYSMGSTDRLIPLLDYIGLPHYLEKGTDDYSFYLGNQNLDLSPSYFMLVHPFGDGFSNKAFNMALVRVSRSSIDFTANINRVELGSSSDRVPFNKYTEYSNYKYNVIEQYCSYNYIRYYDVNDNYIEFAFALNITPDLYDTLFLKQRTYFIGNVSGNDYYDAGYSAGVKTAQDNSYSSGLVDGQKLGYEKGYIAGLNAEELTAGKFFMSIFDMLDVKIFGILSLGDLLMVGVSLSLVLIFLKIFAGG